MIQDAAYAHGTVWRGNQWKNLAAGLAEIPGEQLCDYGGGCITGCSWGGDEEVADLTAAVTKVIGGLAAVR